VASVNRTGAETKQPLVRCSGRGSMPTEEFTPGSRPLVEEMPSSGGAPASESGNTFVAAAPYGESAGTRQASVTKSADPAGANAPQDPEPVPGVSGAVPDEVAGSLPPRGIEALGPTTPSGVGSPGPAPETPTPMSPGDVGTSGSTPSSGSGRPTCCGSTSPSASTWLLSSAEWAGGAGPLRNSAGYEAVMRSVEPTGVVVTSIRSGTCRRSSSMWETMPTVRPPA